MTTQRGWTQREGKRFVFEVCLLCNITALICLFLAFCTPYWIVSWPRVYNPFKKIGLWEVCFAGLVLEMDPTQKSYHGCWWILAPEFRNITKWLMPSWFVWTQVVVTFCFVAQMINVTLLMLIWCRTGWTQRDAAVRRRRDPFILLNTSFIITFVSTIVMAVTLIVFGVMFKVDRHWLPNPNLNYLSWSYGLALISTFFTIFASIGQITYLMIIKQEMREPPRADPMFPVTSMWAQDPASEPLTRSTESLHKSKEQLSKSKSAGSTSNLTSSREMTSRSNERLDLTGVGGDPAA